MLVERRHAVDERGDVGWTSDLFEFACLRERFLQRNEIDRLIALAEHDHLLEDAAMRIAEEVVGADDLDCEIEGFVVDQDGAEHGALGLEVVRQRTLCGGGDGVGHVGNDSVKDRTKDEGRKRRTKDEGRRNEGRRSSLVRRRA